MHRDGLALKGCSNIEALIETTIEGSGLSSSAAMEMGFGTLWRELDHLDIDDSRLAKLGQFCENELSE